MRVVSLHPVAAMGKCCLEADARGLHFALKLGQLPLRRDLRGRHPQLRTPRRWHGHLLGRQWFRPVDAPDARGLPRSLELGQLSLRRDLRGRHPQLRTPRRWHDHLLGSAPLGRGATRGPVATARGRIC